MNIFISHSSKDKWAARRISDDLINLGATTFLDEKDIETCQSIDAEIKKKLKNCDDFLIILSPASIKSEWVLIELGGALALEKNVIPILLYVGTNEIPQVINLKLARDINSIQLYYDEKKNIISGRSIKESIIRKPTIKNTFKSGTRVIIVSTRPEDVMRNDSLIDWEPEMDRYLGQKTAIIAANANNVKEAYSLEIDRGRHVFAKEWLIPIQ